MPTSGGLGRRTPSDWDHVSKYALTSENAPSAPTPVAIGINWYDLFDNPTLIGGDWWINARSASTNLGSIRGGHALCLEPGGSPDTDANWSWYDQGNDGACVGFSLSRMTTLLNDNLYDARWLWDIAKTVDEFSDSNPGDNNGTSVRAGCDVLRDKGHVIWSDTYLNRTWQERDKEPPRIGEGIESNVWATSAQEVANVLQNPEGDKRGAVVLLNSWGKSYPHRVYVALEILDRLIKEDGEAALVVDRVVAPPVASFNPGDRVSYGRAGAPRRGFVDHVIQLATSTQAVVLEDPNGVYHLDVAGLTKL